MLALKFRHIWFIQQNFSQLEHLLHNPITVSWAHSRESLLMGSNCMVYWKTRFKLHILWDQLSTISTYCRLHFSLISKMSLISFLKKKSICTFQLQTTSFKVCGFFISYLSQISCPNKFFTVFLSAYMWLSYSYNFFKFKNAIDRSHHT
jgi:hypothetical protein